jgi:group I intron endonuclease
LAYIYILTNKVNGKKYIGQTVQSIKKRFKEYESNNSKLNRCINKAIKKHGFINFNKFYFLCPIFLLDTVEKFLILFFKYEDYLKLKEAL